MDITKLKRIFEFLEAKENLNQPVVWKLINDIPLKEEDLNVKGDLDLRFSSITSLPKGLKVGGNLFLSYSDITSLPEGLKVGCNIYLSETLKIYKAWEIRNMIKPGGYINGTIKR